VQQLGGLGLELTVLASVKRRQNGLYARPPEKRDQLTIYELHRRAHEGGVVVPALRRHPDPLARQIGAERAIDEDRIGTRLGGREEDVKMPPLSRQLVLTGLQGRDRHLR
jgi:hypothetical protein